ncbi:MAG: ester cyclase [Acidobacteria bacterium]|nr:ester cyclase [Acidobacteriota bacterium]
MSEENKALIRRWFEEVWNKGRAEAIDELFAEDGVAHGLAGDGGDGELRGPAGFKPFFQRFRDAFPDVEVVVEDTIAEGDMVVARCSVRGRHQSDSLGFAATNQPVEFDGITIGRVRDGKIVEAWNNFDFMKMFQQCGALKFNATNADERAGAPPLPAQD